jgi:zinc/manganese transport system substrate-binding protein
VRALFLENVSDPRLLDQIGRETGLVTSGILYSDALSREDGPVPNYLSLLEHNANMIAQALEAP